MWGKEIKKVLILAPHTDDGELGCGATIHKMTKQGLIVFYVAFSACEESVPEGFDRDSLRKEVILATGRLGIQEENVTVLTYQVRLFSDSRQKILDDMIKLRNKIKPDLVFTPSLDDTHQDHFTIADESFRAYKKVNLLAYEVPWNNRKFSPQYYEILEEEDMCAKIEALACYKTQQFRDYVSADIISANAKYRGVQVSAPYAEAFEVLRIIN